MNEKPTVKIIDWALVIHGDAYTPPELMLYYLVGKVIGHPKRVGKSENVRTSRLLCFDGKSRLAETLNTVYLLGRASKDFRAYLKKEGKTICGLFIKGETDGR